MIVRFCSALVGFHLEYCVVARLYIPSGTVRVVFKRNAADSVLLPDTFYLVKNCSITDSSNTAHGPAASAGLICFFREDSVKVTVSLHILSIVPFLLLVY